MSDQSNNEHDPENEDIVLVRRIDRRLEARAKTDYPWLRRLIGFGIIAAAFFYGWIMLNRQSTEIIKLHKKDVEVRANDVAESESSNKPGAIANDADDSPKAMLDSATLNTISVCTKGITALRDLNFNSSDIAAGEATIEKVFAPVLGAQSKHVLQSQNVRIRLKNGEELRLQAAPETANGPLLLKLYRVADNGLPEEIEFPEQISDLKGKRLSDTGTTKFLQLADPPGRALEVERHESWTYPGNIRNQIIWSGTRIVELQTFMPNRFLACSRGVRGGVATMSCKCVER